MSDLIQTLAEQIVQDNAVLFVGARLRAGPLGRPAVQQIADALAERIRYTRPDRSLPAVARDFEVLQGRAALIMALREELERLGGEPGPVHQLLADAVLPSTKVITTRFDRTIEHALDQLHKPYVLIIRDTDLPFFDETKVTLIKLQGDITQPDSLVLTEDDVDAFIERLPTVSDVVRAYFATKTLIFLGYDLADDHFKRFFRQVTRNLAGYRRTAYAIVPDPVDEVELRYWRAQNVEIHTHAPMEFLERLALSVKDLARRAIPRANPVEHLAQPPRPERPYKGLDAFDRDDMAVFAGRMEESHRLVNRILANRLTVLYGESGSGKTSLMRAGVAPLLARQRSLLAMCELGSFQDIDGLLRDSLARTARGAGLDVDPADDLPTLIRRLSHTLDGPVVVALDPLEQLWVSCDEAERQSAFELLASLKEDRSLDLRLVLVIREDFLGLLSSAERWLPGIMDVRFRLDRLGREAARAAIEEPARSFDVAWEPSLVDRLLDDLDLGDGGISPAQLALICDQLYTDAMARAEPGAAVKITRARYEAMGGSAGILGRYMERVLAELPPEQGPVARRILGALVSSRGVRQQLGLTEVARIADVEVAEAVALLTRLVGDRLVRRVDAADGEPRFELSHEALIPQIARWLGDDFWASQRIREILRSALVAWEERETLMARSDVAEASARAGLLRLSDAEQQMLYAMCIASAIEPGPWADALSREARWEAMTRLAEHPDDAARAGALSQLATFDDEAAAAILVQHALRDPAPAVRRATATAIANLHGARDRAVSALVDALGGEDRRSAWEALILVRDLEPAVESALPDGWRGRIRRGVWRERWLRGLDVLLREALEGMQIGFWGLALGMGALFGLVDIAMGEGASLDLRTTVQLMSLGMPLAGLIGAVALGGSAWAATVVDRLADRERPWRDWAAGTLAGALLMGLGFVALTYVFKGTPRPWRAALAGLWVGAAVSGGARLPWPRWRLARIALALLLSVGAFVAVARVGGTRVGAGETLASMGHVLRVEPWGDHRGHLSVGLAGRAGGTGKELEIAEAVALFDFGREVAGVYLCARSEGAAVTVVVDDVSLDVSDLLALDGRPVARGRLTVTPECRDGAAKVRVDGSLRRLGVGGERLWLDHLCVLDEPGCVTFEDLPTALTFDRAPLWGLVWMGIAAGSAAAVSAWRRWR
ncbi:MAG: hypothetical protein Kow0047_21070 [Anaerolineae bacterium]